MSVPGGGPRRSPGRPSKLTAERAEPLLAALRSGLSKRDACKKAGVAPTTFYEWLRRGARALAQANGGLDRVPAAERPYAEFSEALEKARAGALAECPETPETLAAARLGAPDKGRDDASSRTGRTPRGGSLRRGVGSRRKGRVAIVEAGVHTWDLLFACGPPAGPWNARLGGRYGRYWSPRGVLRVSGPAAAGGLCPADRLCAEFGEVCALVADAVGPFEFRGVSRLDTGVTLLFPAVEEAAAFLGALAAYPMSGWETCTHAEPPGLPHSVAWVPIGRTEIRARIYDKDCEQEPQGGRSLVVRLEAQHRYEWGQRPAVQKITGPYLRDRLAQRFKAVLPARPKTVRGVRVAPGRVVAAALAEDLWAGDGAEWSESWRAQAAA